MGYKAYSDSYLMSLTKAQIIELLRIAEHNFFATEEALNNSAKAGMEMAEKYEKAKRLLKAAMKDMKMLYESGKDEGCVGIEFKWRYADEALKLIEDDAPCDKFLWRYTNGVEELIRGEIND